VSFSFLLLAPTHDASAIFAWAAIALELSINPTGLESVGNNPKSECAIRAFPLIPGLQFIQFFPDVSLVGLANELFENSHTGFAANEQLDTAAVTNHIRFALLGFPFVKALPAKRAREPPYRVLNQV
jgi:hypothetical protein